MSDFEDLENVDPLSQCKKLKIVDSLTDMEDLKSIGSASESDNLKEMDRTIEEVIAASANDEVAEEKRNRVVGVLTKIKDLITREDGSPSLIESVVNLLRMEHGLEVYSELTTNSHLFEALGVAEGESHIRFNLQRIGFVFTAEYWKKLDAIDKKYNKEIDDELVRLITEMHMKIEETCRKDMVDLDRMHTHFYETRKMFENGDSFLERIKKEYAKNVVPQKKKQLASAKRSLYCTFCLSTAVSICCFRAAYCCRECQLHDWKKGHYLICERDLFQENCKKNEVSDSDVEIAD